MAQKEKVVVKRPSGEYEHSIDPTQVLRASNALLGKLQSDSNSGGASRGKVDLLADAEVETADSPVWLIVTTKKHIVNKPHLKPRKIPLPHPYLDTKSQELRICIITADPQRKYKDLLADPSFPVDVSRGINRVLGLAKLKSKYKTFEARRQLLSEYDIFLADDRIITYLPGLLGKTFYKTTSKRPIPLNLSGRRESIDEQGNKRRKLAEGGTKVTRVEVKPTDAAHEIQRALSSAIVHFAPSTTTAVKIAVGSMGAKQVQENIETVVRSLVANFVPQGWNNLRAIHIKGANTVALPIWMAVELWETVDDIHLKPLPSPASKKRKLGALGQDQEDDPVSIEVPGPDGNLRRLDKPSRKRTTGAIRLIEPKDSDNAGVVSAQDGKGGKASRKAKLREMKRATKERGGSE